MNEKLINKFIQDLHNDPLLRDHLVKLFFNVGFDKNE